MSRHQTLFGMPVYIETPQPRYSLPLDVPPGTGCTRTEFEEWSKRVCGYQPSLLTDGAAVQVAGRLHMNANTFLRLKTTKGQP